MKNKKGVKVCLATARLGNWKKIKKKGRQKDQGKHLVKRAIEIIKSKAWALALIAYFSKGWSRLIFLQSSWRGCYDKPTELQSKPLGDANWRSIGFHDAFSKEMLMGSVNHWHQLLLYLSTSIPNCLNHAFSLQAIGQGWFGKLMAPEEGNHTCSRGGGRGSMQILAAHVK